MKPLSFFSAQSLLAALGIVCALGHSANDPAPRNEQWWQDRQKLLNQRAADEGDKAQVIFIGDSITQGWEGEGKEVWARFYGPRHAVNLGIGGDRTQHVLWRLEHGNVDGLKPKAAVVMIGTNNSNGEDNTPGQIVEGVSAIVQKLREKLPETKVVLLAIFPRSENFSLQRGKVLQVNQVLRKLADNKDVFWIDFGHQLVNKDGTIPAELMPDYLHLSKRGYQIWAQAMERRLAGIIGDQPVQAQSDRAANLDGEWTSSIRGADGQSFDSRLILKSEGGKLTGRLSRGEDRWLEIQNAEVNGNEIAWTVKRDRPDGSMITYRMSGKVSDGQIKGVAKTQLDGQEQSVEWTARRK